MKPHLLIFSLMFMLMSCSEDSADLRTNTPQGNFEALWNIIDTRYCYFDEKDIDWQGVRDKLQPRADNIRQGDHWALFYLLSDMLDTLRDSHVNLYTPFDMSHYDDRYADYPQCFSSSLIFHDKYLGSDYHIAGGLYYQYLRDSVGYVRYSSMNTAISVANIAYVFNYFQRARGIIIDLRGNPGGSLNYSELLASSFMESDTEVGYRRHKTGTGHTQFSSPQKITLKPSATQWLRPAVLLADRGTYSAANHCVLCMSYAPKVTIIGCKSGGGGALPMSYELPNGWLVRLSSVPMYDMNMNSIEDGIEPDITLPLDIELARQGTDNLIETAIDHILSN